MAPVFAAYRDGFTDDSGKLVAWKSLTPSTKIDFMAAGPFTVTVVCLLDSGNTILTWQALHAADADDTTKTVTEPTIQSPCSGPPAATVAVTGTLVEPGSIHIGDAGNDVVNTSPNQPFTLQVTPGTYDVIASSTDANVKKALIQRNVMVTAAVDRGAVDAATGTPLVALGLSLDNPPKAFDPATPTKNTETVQVEVQVVTKNNSGPGRVWVAPYDLTAKAVTTMGIPNDQLTADDTQQGKFTGINMVPKTSIITTRSITKPFSVGDAVAKGTTGFGLPTLISIPAWTMDTTNRLGVALPALPALDALTISTSGTSATNAAKTAKYQMEITTNYLAETSLAHPVFDTSITGFSNDWTIDFSKAYSRDIVSEHDVITKNVFTGHETSSFHEDVNP
ncbi:MAG TPA: hypothetical protein VHW23_39980 [Kofleriaceae bacterium]|nr:hypothetical protein [Kofleriaceae bacterium]